jgi:hypothetical protein
MLKPVYEDTEVFSCNDLYIHALSAPSGNKIWNACHEIAQLLVEKNISYGDSALSPNRIFAQSDNVEQLKVRIDDKLNRVKNNQGYAGDNDIDDLIGYLILLKIAVDKNTSKEV